ARNYVKTVLKMRLGDIPIEIEQAVDKISVLSILDELLKSALTVNSFDELHQLLEQ
ncbi:transposase, partial [Microcystis aeruginosa KLA2]